MDQRPAKPFKKAKICYSRFSSREPDFDNLVNSFKRVQDCLIKCGIIENDKPSNIGQPTYVWISAKKNEGRIEITIEQVE